MTLRFTNRAIKSLFDKDAIDLMKLDGEVISDPQKRLAITQAGSDLPPEEVANLCEEMTPGEHIQLLTEAIQRDLIPSSIREATAKAAASSKSAETPAAAA